MRWRQSPPFGHASRNYEAFTVIQRLEGFNIKQSDNEARQRLVVEIKWKGLFSFFGLRRKILMINLTEEGDEVGDGVVQWKNQDFHYSGHVFPWELHFTIFNGLNQGQRQKVPAMGTATLNLAKYANSDKEKELQIKVPLTVSGDTIEGDPYLCLSFRLIESRFAQESLQAGQRSIVPLTTSPTSGEAVPMGKDELSAVKAGLQKMKIFKDFVSRQRRAKKTCTEQECCDGKGSDAEYDFVSETDSPDDDARGNLDMNKEKAIVHRSFSYETLASAKVNLEDEGWIYYRSCNLDCVENSKSLQQTVKRGILPWRKRKLRFRSRKTKEEPLLKKDYREEGGDDIDFVRRQLSSSDDSSFGWRSEGSTTSRSSFSEFGNDNFSVGCWERKEVISRDGNMKLEAQVFLASIDQRSERAAGESACTALVAVIANWLQCNPKEMPTKSELDNLIREGSLDWRNLCENEEYIRRFPDKHFDLETVLEAQICPLFVVPENSFVGFFHPEGLELGGNFNFLHGAMSFDSIWDEIIRCGSTDPSIYIISWNDHFFVLKIEQEAYYIIDTLGERLYEGCNQAYILKFDKDATIKRPPKDTKSSEENRKASDKAALAVNPSKGTAVVCRVEEGTVYRGKESCKEYIKSFLAAIPIRELHTDIKKGLMASTPLHHRLQIEFHYTRLLKPQDAEFAAGEVTNDDKPAMQASLAVA
ncbi:hypothetical protein WN943_019041 [Citrus x changshan-huyou]